MRPPARAARCDASPRGDPLGFARVLSDRTLLLPDRKGNRRVDVDEVFFRCARAFLRAACGTPRALDATLERENQDLY